MTELVPGTTIERGGAPKRFVDMPNTLKLMSDAAEYLQQFCKTELAYLTAEFAPSSSQQRPDLHRSRYDFFGSALHRTAVRFGWEALPFAELRDLNRHRTGTKFFTLRPVGAYFAEDEIDRAEEEDGCLAPLCEKLREVRDVGEQAVRIAVERLSEGLLDFVYWLPMGTQCYYEHTTTANHFLYQCELRTGLGAHYVYAARMNEVLDIWHDRYPGTRQFVKAGTAEPE